MLVAGRPCPDSLLVFALGIRQQFAGQFCLRQKKKPGCLPALNGNAAHRQQHILLVPLSHENTNAMNLELYDQNDTLLDQPEPQRQRPSPLIITLALLLLISLGLHAWTITTLLNIRDTARNEMLALTGEIAAARTDTIDLEVPIKQRFPVDTTVRVQEEIVVPVDTTVNVNEQVSFPVSTPFGNTVITFPVQATVPVSTTIPVTIDETFPISTEVLIDMRLPISLPIDETPIGGYLEQLQQRLEVLISEL